MNSIQKINVFLFFCFVSLITSKLQCQTIFSNEGKYGIIDDWDKKTAISPIYDKITECFKQEGFGGLDNYKNHGFILEKDNRYYFVLRQFWETKYFRNMDFAFSQDWGQIDSVKWIITQQSFDDLYPLEQFEEDEKISIDQVELFQNDTCLSILRIFHVLVYKQDDKLGLVSYEKVSRDFGNAKVGDVYLEKRVFSFENIQIHPPNYSSINILRSINHRNTSIRGNNRIIVSKGDKYGIINLQDNYEIAPQFDSIPSLQVIDYDRFFYAKKNGLWGVIYLNKYLSDYVVSIPFRFASIDDISRNLQVVSFYKRRIIKNGEELKIQLQDKYISCLYQSGIDQPLQFEFIVYGGESFSQTILNKITKKEELNKEYIPPTEKHITFTPLINNAPVIQQDRFEFICISKSKDNVDDTSSWFFILKRERKRDRNDNHYANEIIEAKAIYSYIYDFTNDRFVSIYNFDEELENINYNVIVKPRDFDCNLILKSTSVENEKFKHEFFTFEGLKVYELISNYPINYIEYMIEDYRGETYNPDWHVLKFYTEIPGKKKTKKKTVCHYNTKTKQFYK